MKYSIWPKASVIMMNCTPAVRSDRKPTTSPASAAQATASGHITSAAWLPLQPNSVSPCAKW